LHNITTASNTSSLLTQCRHRPSQWPTYLWAFSLA